MADVTQGKKESQPEGGKFGVKIDSEEIKKVDKSREKGERLAEIQRKNRKQEYEASTTPEERAIDKAHGVAPE